MEVRSTEQVLIHRVVIDLGHMKPVRSEAK